MTRSDQYDDALIGAIDRAKLLQNLSAKWDMDGLGAFKKKGGQPKKKPTNPVLPVAAVAVLYFMFGRKR